MWYLQGFSPAVQYLITAVFFGLAQTFCSTIYILVLLYPLPAVHGTLLSGAFSLAQFHGMWSPPPLDLLPHHLLPLAVPAPGVCLLLV